MKSRRHRAIAKANGERFMDEKKVFGNLPRTFSYRPDAKLTREKGRKDGGERINFFR